MGGQGNEKVIAYEMRITSNIPDTMWLWRYNVSYGLLEFKKPPSRKLRNSKKKKKRVNMVTTLSFKHQRYVLMPLAPLS